MRDNETRFGEPNGTRTSVLELKAKMPHGDTLQVPLDRPAAKAPFRLVLPWGLAGDQPGASAGLLSALRSRERHTTLRRGTGSGKTGTIAKVIPESWPPAPVLPHHQTHAAPAFRHVKEVLFQD